MFSKKKTKKLSKRFLGFLRRHLFLVGNLKVRIVFGICMGIGVGIGICIGMGGGSALILVLVSVLVLVLVLV